MASDANCPKPDLNRKASRASLINAASQQMVCCSRSYKLAGGIQITESRLEI